MGQILRIFLKEDCFSSEQDQIRIFVDFENAQPNADELEAYALIQQFLEDSTDVLSILQHYQGAKDEIKDAIQNKSEETEKKVLEKLLPSMENLKKCYLFSQRLEKIVPLILKTMTSDIQQGQTVFDILDCHQALVKQFAHLVEFVLIFDELKINNSQAQNDFSYYRRTLKSRPTDELDLIVIAENDAVSRFLANSTPMLAKLTETLSKSVEINKEFELTTEILGTMVQVCQKMLDSSELRQRIQSVQTELFILRIMVGLIVLFDHVHASGAFAKGSQIDVKGAIKIVREQGGENADNLLNILRYTTKHLNEEKTPKEIKKALNIKT